MFDQLKKLAGQTAVYGVSSILGKVLNFMLVPLHTMVLTREAFGENTDIYSLIAFLVVIFTYGLETSFFRFSEKFNDQKNTVYTTALISIISSTVLFLLIVSIFNGPITTFLKYENDSQYVWWMFIILAMDTLAAIPFARLRAQGRGLRFVSVKMALIGANVFFNILFFAPVLINKNLPFDLCPYWFGQNLGVGYIFIANMLASGIMLLMLLPEFLGVNWQFDKRIWKQMLLFGLPLMISGLAGVANEMLDRQLLKYLLPEDVWRAEVGIYGAVYKLSIFLVLFNQAFRYAAEPFFFSSANQENARKTFATVMTYFVIVMSVGFVLIMAYLDVFKHFIDAKFWEGLYIVPILLLANVFLGINTNLSFWYKLSDRTNQAIWITGFGLLLTIVFNIWLIPILGYAGAAWATLISYAGMMLLSFILGQHYYPIPYETRKISLILFVATLLGYIAYHYAMPNFMIQTVCFVLFLAFLAFAERDVLRKLRAKLSTYKK